MDGLQIEESKRDQIFELRAGQNVLVFVGLDQVLEAVEFSQTRLFPGIGVVILPLNIIGIHGISDFPNSS
jgi:hypothetical protein